jgi:hypothetical protein
LPRPRGAKLRRFAALAAACMAGATLPATAAPLAPALLSHGETRQATLQRVAALAARPAPPGPGLPAILFGRIATPTVTIGKAPALPEIDIAYQAPAGLQNVTFLFFSPSGAQHIQITYSPASPGPHTGTVKLQNSIDGALGLWSEPGAWQLAVAAINGFAGEEVYYTAAQLAAIFPTTSFTLVNRNPADITPPAVAAAKFLTPAISLSANYPYAAGEFSVTDDVSGAATAEIDIISPTQQYYALYGSAARPAKTGKIVAGLDIGSLPNPPTGTWQIAGYVITDAAGNDKADYNATDIQALFGTTTFEVTN